MSISKPLACKFCGRGMKQLANLTRINEKGVPGEWVCEICSGDTRTLAEIIKGEPLQ